MPRSLAITLATLALAAPALAEKPLRIATLPFDDAPTQEAVFGPLSQQLSARLGRAVRFVVSQSYDEVIAGLQDGELDVAFVGASSFLAARRTRSVRVILRSIRHRATAYRGVIVVGATSRVSAVPELRGKRVAFVDRASSGGYVYPRALFAAAGLDVERDLQPVFAGSHRAVVELVAAGKVDAGACVEGVVDGIADPSSVRPIARTELIPGDPVVVRAGLGRPLVGKLRAALMALPTTREGATLLRFADIDGFVPATDEDYERDAALAREGR